MTSEASNRAAELAIESSTRSRSRVPTISRASRFNVSAASLRPNAAECPSSVLTASMAAASSAVNAGAPAGRNTTRSRWSSTWTTTAGTPATSARPAGGRTVKVNGGPTSCTTLGTSRTHSTMPTVCASASSATVSVTTLGAETAAALDPSRVSMSVGQVVPTRAASSVTPSSSHAYPGTVYPGWE